MTQTTFRSQSQSVQPTSWTMLAFIAGVLIVFSALVWAGAAWQRINRMNAASGVVVQLDEFADDHGVLMYLPVVEFKTAEGKTIRTRTSLFQKLNLLGFDFEIESVMGAPNQYHVGDAMPVYYDPQNPQDTQLNDWWQLWSTPVGAGAVGGIVIVFALIFQSMGQRRATTA